MLSVRIGNKSLGDRHRAADRWFPTPVRGSCFLPASAGNLTDSKKMMKKDS